jgi:hypothetical protein
MITITIDLLKYGMSKPETIATGMIKNKGDGTEELGNYEVKFGLNPGEWVACEVEEFPRNEKNVWELLHAALTAAQIKAAANKLKV